MMSAMPATTWLEWKVYMSLNPFSSERLDLLFASIAAAIWNVQIAKGAGKNTPKFLPLKDFLLAFGDAPNPNTPKRRRGKDAQASFNTLVQALKDYAKPTDSSQQPEKGLGTVIERPRRTGADDE